MLPLLWNNFYRQSEVTGIVAIGLTVLGLHWAYPHSILLVSQKYFWGN